MKKTPWFPGSVKPVRNGVYERDYPNSGVVFCRFYKGAWQYAHKDHYIASRQTEESFTQDFPWRGLAQDPIKGGK